MDAIERRLRVSGEAADWWATLHAEAPAREDRERFVEWLRESHVHVTEMLRVMQVHGALDGFDEWKALPKEQGETMAEVIAFSRAPSARREMNSSAWRWLPAAAAAMAFVIAAAVWLLPALGGQVIATERGERREVVLGDGSVVQVDPQTRLRIQYDDAHRRVVLTDGRALFRVARHPTQPFLVEAQGATIRAIGTAFGVERRKNNAVVVTVVEGKVAVQAQGAAQPDFLSANQQITVGNARAAIPVHAVDGEQALAWAKGKLIFKDEIVAEIVAEFNRYNRVQLQVNDAALAGRRVSGVFDAAYPEEFVAFIRGATPVQIERIEGKTIALHSLPMR